jgi:hypothetical protein
MTREELSIIIHEEVGKMLDNTLNEVYDLDKVSYNHSVHKEVENLVSQLKKTNNLSKVQVASILNDIILALGLNRTQMTMYMNMIKQQRQRYSF